MTDQVFALALPLAHGVLDTFRVLSTGLIRAEGWSRGDPPSVEIFADQAPLSLLHSYRLRRPDAAAAVGSLDSFLGFVLEWLVSGPAPAMLTIYSKGHRLAVLWPLPRIEQPHYAHLFAQSDVLHREHIYGVGPPNLEADPIVIELATALPGSVLDFGCGSGALVRALRSKGRKAHGLEIYRPPILESLRDDVRPHITLYDGAFPSSLEAFDSVICTEVLEHIPDWRGAIAEIARLCRRSAVFTVPDMSSIPTAFPHHVVPWHLLEATHVNFFTQHSLALALGTVFRRVSFGKIGDFEINGTRLYTSLVAFCER